jgi:hypothetical protein
MGESDPDALYRNFLSSLDFVWGMRRRTIRPQTDSLAAIQQFTIRGKLNGDYASHSHVALNGLLSSFTDEATATLRETSAHVGLEAFRDFSSGHLRLQSELRYDFVGDVAVRSAGFSSSGADLGTFGLSISQRNTGPTQWTLGATLAKVGDFTRSAFVVLPQAEGRFIFNPRWDLGVSFSPKAAVQSFQGLARQNPFFSAIQQSLVRAFDTTVDPPQRPVATDAINVSVFTNYFLSTDDEMSLQARLVTRTNEVIFEASGDTSRPGFVSSIRNTRRLELEFRSRLLFFERDILTTTFDYHSATIAGEDRAIPFEPVVKLRASYLFNGLSERIKPELTFEVLARKEKSLSFVDLAIPYRISDRLRLLLEVENLLGGPSDYWSGYAEKVRALWGSIEFRL